MKKKKGGRRRNEAKEKTTTTIGDEDEEGCGMGEHGGRGDEERRFHGEVESVSRELPRGRVGVDHRRLWGRIMADERGDGSQGDGGRKGGG